MMKLRNKQFSLDDEFLLNLPTRLRVPEEVAVIGAGRWGKIICNVLTQFSPPVSKIHLLAERNYAEASSWLKEKLTENHQNNAYERVELSESFGDILNNSSIEAAFVTKMAAQHYAATKRLLLHRKHVFVEKPFVLDMSEANELVRLAAKNNRVLAVGYEYMVARHIHRLSNMMEKHLTDVSSIDVFWEDPATEVKWGVQKQPDLSSNIVTDLYPHILSQLFVLLGKEHIALKNFHSSDACWEAKLELLYGTTAVSVNLNKSATESRRLIRVTSSGDEQLELDHTKEPGDLRLNGTLLPPEPRIDSFPSPITSEFAYFFSEIERPIGQLPTAAKNTLHIVEATAHANSILFELQSKLLRDWLFRDSSIAFSENVLQVLRHHMMCPLLDRGLISDPKDVEGLDKWLVHVAAILRQFSGAHQSFPEGSLDGSGLSDSHVVQLNAAIRDSSFLEPIMSGEEFGKKGQI